jgi:hypothetical protein
VLNSRRQLSSGGGSEAVRNPRRHGEHLETSLSAALAARPRVVVEGVDPRLVFKLGATARLTDDDLRRRGLVLLGDTADWTYLVVPFDVEARQFREGLAAYQAGDDEDGGNARYRGFFELVDALEPYGPDDRRGPHLTQPLGDDAESRLVVDVVIWPSSDNDAARRRLADVRAVLTEFEGTELSVDARPQTTVVRALVGSSCLDALLQLSVVEQVRGPMLPFIAPSDWLTVDVDRLQLSAPIDVPIGVVDDGVAADHPLLRDLIVGVREFPAGRTWAPPSPHGTMVAGLAAYGDFERALRDGTPLPAPVRIYCARVLEPDPQDGSRTKFPSEVPEHEVVESAVRTLHAEGVRVFNISIADPDAFSGPHVSLLTEVVDRLVRELDVVIVVSAGNRPVAATGDLEDGKHAFRDYPAYVLNEQARVAEPALAANALVVGSVAQSAGPALPGDRSLANDHAIAGVDELSPFSRTGPGVLGAVKPDVVEAGGNWVWNGLDRIDTRNLGVGVVSTRPPTDGRLFGSGSGTSYAAPRVANLAARVLARYPGASANLVRALIGLSAHQRPASVAQIRDPGDALRAYGYGRPRAADALDSDDERVVMFYEGQLEVDTVAIHPLPVPEAFARGRSERTVAISLAFDPPVRRQRREYIAASMRLDLYRATDPEALERIWRHQDPKSREPLIGGRRRVTSRLKPGTERLLDSTLHVRTWRADHAMSLSPDDGDTYFLVVSHSSAPWAGYLEDDYKSQRYAVAVALSDRERQEVELYNLVQQQVRVPARVRIQRS